MKPTTRDRLVLPILLPLGILVGMIVLLVGFSRILLSITPTAAWIVAFVVAATVVAAAALAASRRQVRLSTIGSMVGVIAGVAMLTGGIALAVAAGEGEEGEEEVPVVALAAFDIAFEPTTLQVPAGEPFTIRFHNQDADVQHNVEIFQDEEFSGTALFAGDLIAGVRTLDYAVGALDPGPYFFRCVVHPTMTGEMEAAPGEGGGPGGPEPGGPAGPGVTVVAQNTAFEPTSIALPASQEASITFENRDPGIQHNIAIYRDETLAEELFNGDLITGVESTEYAVPPLEAGEYPFICIVHPTMTGTVSVA